MSNKQKRVIGADEASIEAAERQLNFQFPPSFRAWLLQNNGRGIEDVTIFPVFDKRDSRKTWDSIVRNYQENWIDWLKNFNENTELHSQLPFAEMGDGDYFCFDYSRLNEKRETPVVLWSHETGSSEDVADNFADFVERVEGA